MLIYVSIVFVISRSICPLCSAGIPPIMKSLKLVRDACIGAGQCTCHTFWLPLWRIFDNFVSSQVDAVDSFSLVKKINSFMLWENVHLVLLLKMIFSAFHKVQWQHFSGVVDMFENTYAVFLQDSVYRKLFLLVIFDGVIQNTKMWPLFLGHCVEH